MNEVTATVSAQEDLSTAAPPSSSRSRRASVLALLVAGLLGGAVSAPLVHRYENQFPMVNLTVEETNLLRANPDDPVAWAIERGNRWDALFRNTALCMAIFGAVLGAAVGLADGLVQRSPGRGFALMGLLALCGAVSGLPAGLANGVIGLEMQDNRDSDPLPYAMAMHVSSFVIVSLAIGAGLGFRSRKWSVLIRAAAGGLVAGLLFAPLASFLFPLYRTDLPVPEGIPPKLVFLMTAGGLIGVCIGRSPFRVFSAVPVGAPAHAAS